MLRLSALAVLTLWVSACKRPSSIEPPPPPPPPDTPCVPRDLDRGKPFCGGEEGLPAGVTLGSGAQFQLGFGAADLTLAPVADGVLRVRYLPAGEQPRAQSFVVLPQTAPAFQYGRSCGALLLCTSTLAARVDPAQLTVRVTDASGAVLLDDRAPWFASQELQELGVVRPVRGVRHALDPEVHFFGGGDRTGRLERRGRALIFWATDAYDEALGGFRADMDPLYKAIPFVIAQRGTTAWGVYLDNSWHMRFDLGAGNPGQWTVTANGGALDHYLVAGPSMAEVLERYTALTGRPMLPPRWSLGYHQSRWGWPDAARVQQIAAEFRQRRLPVDVLHLDIQHMRGFRSFTWDPAAFPQPASLVSQLAQSGFKLVAIDDPGLKIDPGWDVYDDGLAGDHFVRDASGKVYQGEVWPGAAVFPDFTAARTRTWWGALCARESALGIRGLWLDMNEPSSFLAHDTGKTLPSTAVLDGDGAKMTMAEGHNLYALQELRASWEGLKSAAPAQRPFLLTRSGFSGLQRYAATWTGDSVSNWSTLKMSPAMLAGLSLSGVPFSGSDVGGYTGRASPELFARWMQVGLFSPFFRGHVTTGVPDQEPWAFGLEVEDISREVLRERYRLLPYLYALFAESHRAGAPVLRPLVYEFPTDAAARERDDQVMLGPWLLYAPVLEPLVTTRKVYLPAGRWFDPVSGAAFDGPGEITRGLTLAALPTFVREGAIVPRGPAMEFSDQAPLSPLTLDVYPAQRTTRFPFYEDEGDGFGYQAGHFSRVVYSLTGSATGAILEAAAREGDWAPPARQVVVQVRRVDVRPAAVKLGGQAIAEGPAGWQWDADARMLAVRFDDLPPWKLELTYDPAVPTLAPPVKVHLSVRVPAGTPQSPAIHVASNANGWVHQPLTWTGADLAEGELLVPRGEWFFFKYTRGGWPTVEKWSGCVEATNRYAYGASGARAEDRVTAWADRCP